MQEYSKLLKNKNQLSQIQKKIGKIQLYFARIQDDMIFIRNQALEAVEQSNKNKKQLDQRLENINKAAFLQLKQIDDILKNKIRINSEKFDQVDIRIQKMQQTQYANKNLVLNMIQKIEFMEKQMGIKQ